MAAGGGLGIVGQCSGVSSGTTYTIVVTLSSQGGSVVKEITVTAT